MKLTYTVEIDLGDADITPEYQSAWIMREAFSRVGGDLGGQTIHHLTIWAHQDSEPNASLEDLGAEDREAPIPPETCPTCGIQQFSKAAA